MQFTDGYWLMKEGYTLASATEVVDYKISKNGITLYVAARNIRHRGDTLDGSVLTIEYTAYEHEMFHVNIDHFKGVSRNTVNIPLYANKVECSVEEDEERIVLINGLASISINKKDWDVKFLYNGVVRTGNDWRSSAYIEDTTNHTGYIREQLSLGVSEQIYGLGERFTPFVKNGQSVDIYNEDGGTSSDQAYKNVPFYLSSEGYGIFVNHTKKTSFEVAKENVSRVQFSIEGQNLNYFVIMASEVKEVLVNYTSLTGKPALPPLESFGLWLSTSFTTNYDEATVTHFLSEMDRYEIPLSVFHFDCFWMKGFEWCNFEFDPITFPDPKGMLSRIKARGLEICVWINPYIAQKSPLFKEGMDNGYFIKKPNGDVWQWNRWQAGMAIVDFTNPEAVAWYCGYLEHLMDLGVDCFKTDFGERIPTDVVYHDGSNPEDMHNFYSYLYNKVVFETLQKRKGNKAVVFARSGFAGSQQFPVHWGGDCSSTYSSMAESLRGGLSLTCSGFGFWSHDISGFENTASPDIYKRWSAFGLFSTHSRLHGNTSYRVPWLFDDESVEVVKYFSRFKNRLLPYLFTQAVTTATTGIPSMSAMVVHYPLDKNVRHLDLQYMLGDSILVAPIFNEQSVGEYYLPKGTWTHLLSNEIVAGGQWYTGTFDYFSLPVYVKENTIIPMFKDGTTFSYDLKDLVLYGYQVDDTSVDLVDDNGTLLGSVSIKKIDGTYHIEHNCNFGFTFEAVNEEVVIVID